jgi:hypothetical protein
MYSGVKAAETGESDAHLDKNRARDETVGEAQYVSDTLQGLYGTCQRMRYRGQRQPHGHCPTMLWVAFISPTLPRGRLTHKCAHVRVHSRTSYSPDRRVVHT